MNEIPRVVWDNYIGRLRKVSDTASKKMIEYLSTHEYWLNSQTQQEAVDYAFALVTKYGEGAAAAAAEFFDEIGGAFAGKLINPAEPAATATYRETSKAMYGAMKKSKKVEYIASVTGRLVKQASADTMTMNALKAGAEWAWIPSGDSCAYCTMLASRGWQRASEKALRNGHAEHIHANCDCNYCVRFSDDMDVENYHPEELLKEYRDADTETQGKVTRNRDKNGVLRDYKQSKFDAKVNAMRRENYAKHKDEINKQKKEAYARRKGDGVWNMTQGKQH